MWERERKEKNKPEGGRGGLSTQEHRALPCCFLPNETKELGGMSQACAYLGLSTVEQGGKGGCCAAVWGWFLVAGQGVPSLRLVSWTWGARPPLTGQRSPQRGLSLAVLSSGCELAHASLVEVGREKWVESLSGDLKNFEWRERGNVDPLSGSGSQIWEFQKRVGFWFWGGEERVSDGNKILWGISVPFCNLILKKT